MKRQKKKNTPKLNVPDWTEHQFWHKLTASEKLEEIIFVVNMSLEISEKAMAECNNMIRRVQKVEHRFEETPVITPSLYRELLRLYEKEEAQRKQ